MDIAGIAAILEGSKKKCTRNALWEKFDEKQNHRPLRMVKFSSFFQLVSVF